MFTAIVLDNESKLDCFLVAENLNLLPDDNCKLHCHHVTLAMGDKSKRFKVGEGRTLEVTHFGVLEGRVSAFRVLGADDSDNENPHVTIATYGDGKPKESNEISEWHKLEESFIITGKVEICN